MFISLARARIRTPNKCDSLDVVVVAFNRSSLEHGEHDLFAKEADEHRVSQYTHRTQPPTRTFELMPLLVPVL